LAQKGVALGPQTLDQTRGMQIPLPEFQGIEVPKAPQPSPSSSSGAAAAQSSSPVSWAIPSTAKANYAKLWEGVTKNGQGLMDGKEAALFLAKSGLNREALRTIWQLSDVSSDGKLDQTEFFIAMHLTMMNKKGASLPSSLPNELLQSAKMSQSSSGGGSSRSLLDLDASNSSMMNASAAAMPVQSSLSAEGEARQDAGALNATLVASNRAVGEALNVVRAQSSRVQAELTALRAERERLMAQLSEQARALQMESDRLRELDAELVKTRQEVEGFVFYGTLVFFLFF